MKLKFIILMIVFVMLFLVGCAGNSGPTATPLPSPTPFPTFAFVPPTTIPIATVSPGDDNPDPTLDAQLVERGRGRYVALECGSCHGENGEGTDDGSSLVELALTETEFVDFMRSGGDLGSEHQYSTDRLSESGGRNLYLYITTLSSSD